MTWHICGRGTYTLDSSMTLPICGGQFYDVAYMWTWYIYAGQVL